MFDQLGWYFRIYKLFYDPPGTPRDKKCVKCKLAASAGSGLLFPPMLYAAYKKRTSNFKPMVYGFGAIATSTFSLIMLKVAIDNHESNKKLTKENLERIRMQRLQDSGQLNKA